MTTHPGDVENKVIVLHFYTTENQLQQSKKVDSKSGVSFLCCLSMSAKAEDNENGRVCCKK